MDVPGNGTPNSISSYQKGTVVLNEVLQQMISAIDNLLSKNTVANCAQARRIIEHAYKHYEIEPCHAMELCIRVGHGLCQLENPGEVAALEIEVGNLKMMEQYTIIGRSWKDQEHNVRSLLNVLVRRTEQQVNDYISCVGEAFLSLPGYNTRLELLLSFQAELALVVSRYRVDSRLSDRFDSYEASIANLAYEIELALFEAVTYGAGTEKWKRVPDHDTPEVIRNTLTGWHHICVGGISPKRQMNESLLDSGSRYQYRQIRPGRVTLLNDRAKVRECREYVVPAWIDGRLVTRVEHIPDVKCDVLRFEEGIEEIALTNFHGECRQLVLPDSLTYLRAKSFRGIQSLRHVTMNGAVIEEGAFAKCVNLESVYFGPKLRSILSGAFENCVRLKTIQFPNEVYAIGEDAFRNCGVEALELPKVDTLYNGAFGHCLGLREIQCTGEIAHVYGIPFSECANIQNVVIREGISTLEIMDGALYQIVVDEISEIFLRIGEAPRRDVYHNLVCEISTNP